MCIYTYIHNIYNILCVYIYIHDIIYIYKWTVFVKSAQHAHARMIAIIVEKGPNPSHLYDHGFMNNTNRQAVWSVNHKNIL